MDYNRIIMFCDFGLDDAVALMHILKNGGMFGAIDVVPIGGNVSVGMAFANAHTLLASTSFDTKKVRIVDTRDIEQPAAGITDIHGSDGIGGVLAAKSSDVPVIGFAAFKEELEQNMRPERDCVLSLGPCTLPDMLGYVPFCTVLMGGATRETPNYGDHEFNEALDTEAFAAFAPRAAAVATLDSCQDKSVDYRALRFGHAVEDSLVKRYIELCEGRGAPVAIYDYLAALAVTNPECFTAERIRRPDGVEYNEIKYNA